MYYYTVIAKSKTDRYWVVYNTYDNLEDAKLVQFCICTCSPRPSSPNHYVEIKKHMKSRVALTDFLEGVVSFNDGTIAFLPNRLQGE